MKLKNVTLSELYKLKPNVQAKYNLALSKHNPTSKSIFIKIDTNWVKIKPKVNELFDLPFQDIMKFKEAINENKNATAILDLMIKTVYKISNIDNISIFSYNNFNWLVKDFESILNAEKQLEHKPTNEEKNAGVQELYKFDEFPTLLEIANNDITKIKDVLNAPYKDVFTYLLYKKTLNDVKQKLINSK